ncbi:unnamed protein product, partial [Laminaria digitata]
MSEVPVSAPLQAKPPTDSTREQVQTRSMSANPPAASPATPFLGPPELEPPSPARSHSGVLGDAPVLSPSASVSVASSSSHRSQFTCTPQQQDALGGIAEYLPPDKLETLLASFTDENDLEAVVDNHVDLDADREVAATVALHDAAVARVDAQARALFPESAAVARGNLLCSQEAAREDDRRLREQDRVARATANKMRDKVFAIQTRKDTVAAVQR